MVDTLSLNQRFIDEIIRPKKQMYLEYSKANGGRNISKKQRKEDFVTLQQKLGRPPFNKMHASQGLFLEALALNPDYESAHRLSKNYRFIGEQFDHRAHWQMLQILRKEKDIPVLRDRFFNSHIDGVEDWIKASADPEASKRFKDFFGRDQWKLLGRIIVEEDAKISFQKTEITRLKSLYKVAPDGVRFPLEKKKRPKDKQKHKGLKLRQAYRRHPRHKPNYA